MKQQSSEQLTKRIHAYIEKETSAYAREPMGLYDPITYVLSLGGKRLRPVLMLLAYNLYQEDVERIFPQATGIETYHNFTLLHDDLMDKADTRRNRPTVHKKWNENTAILSGDAMLILSYRFMMQGCLPEYIRPVMEVFGQTALEVCEGQQWDMEFETREDVTINEYLEMIRLKTSVLLAAALKIGAILAGAPAKDAQRLYDFGIRIGLAFQLQDDYLDVYGDPATFGKKIGGDIRCNKKTYMLLSALMLAEAPVKEELHELLRSTDIQPDDKVRRVTDIYNKIGIADICKAKINELYQEGLELIDGVSVAEDRKRFLKEYVEKLMYRNL